MVANKTDRTKCRPMAHRLGQGILDETGSIKKARPKNWPGPVDTIPDGKNQSALGVADPPALPPAPGAAGPTTLSIEILLTLVGKNTLEK